MSKQKTSETFAESLELRCIKALRLAESRQRSEKERSGDLKMLSERLEKELFSAERLQPARLLECFNDLMFFMKPMEQRKNRVDENLQPIGLQVATANDIAPIHLEWNYHNPDSLFVIEYANFDRAVKPEWRVYSETYATSTTIRDLPQGKAYWFRISALATAV